MTTTGRGADLDELAPNHFIINNERVHPFLRGEGTINGNLFDLETWRREGWIARVREGGFSVRTLQDRINALPSIKQEQAAQEKVFRPLSTAKEHWAGFDPQRLRWRDLPIVTQATQRGVLLLINEAVRRRTSRGSGDFFVIMPQRAGGTNLLAITEEQALIHAYSMLAANGEPARLVFTTTQDGYQVAGDGAHLPSRHAETLDRLSTTKARWHFPQALAPLAEQVFAKLGIELVPADSLPPR